MNFTDQRLEGIIANLLRAGVLLSAAVVLAGGTGYLLRHGHETPSYSQFHSEPARYRKIGDIASAAVHGDGRAVIQFGLILLIATPVARVAFSMAGFAAEKDRTYVVVTAIVLMILIYSLAGEH